METSRCGSCRKRLTCSGDELAFGCTGYEPDGAERRARAVGKRQARNWFGSLLAYEMASAILAVGLVIAAGYVLDALGLLGLP